MNIFSTFKQAQDVILGPAPTFWSGESALDGSSYPWKEAAVGSVYIYRTDNITVTYTKVSDTDDSADWVGEGVIYDVDVLYSDFTDNEDATGEYELPVQLPIGAYAPKVAVRNVTGFTGDTSAALTVGDGTDVDRYNTGTPSVFTTAAVVAMGAPSGTQDHAAAATVTLTVTSDSDFTSVSAGSLDVYVHFKVQA